VWKPAGAQITEGVTDAETKRLHMPPATRVSAR
jgi:hypothetical protein